MLKTFMLKITLNFFHGFLTIVILEILELPKIALNLPEKCFLIIFLDKTYC